MSYMSAPALQTAVYAVLVGDTALAALVEGVHDAPPPGTPSGTYVVLGAEEVIDRSDISGPGAEHRFAVQVFSDAPGFLAAKQAAARIAEILPGVTLALETGRLVDLWFHQAQARRLEGGAVRRIELRFRARIEG